MFSPSWVRSDPMPLVRSSAAAVRASASSSPGMNRRTARRTNVRRRSCSASQALCEARSSRRRAMDMRRLLRLPGALRDGRNEVVQPLRRERKCLALLGALIGGHQDLHDLESIVEVECRRVPPPKSAGEKPGPRPPPPERGPVRHHPHPAPPRGPLLDPGPPRLPPPPPAEKT